MEISKRIVVTFVLVSLIPILAISAISVITITDASNESALLASDALRNEELADLERLANDTAIFIQEKIQNYIDGVYMMERYAEDLFNARILATPQHSYFWDWELEFAQTGMLVPGRHYVERYDSSDISFEVSCYYMPRPYYKTPGDPFDWSPSTRYFIEVSSNMDNMYRALHEMSTDYIWLYMAFDPSYCDSHLFRNYPYDRLSYFLGDTPAEDYDPPNEEWYTNAIAFGNESIAFTGPYLDPSTGLVISMARPIRFDNGTVFGVVSADVTLETILQSVLDVKILNSGYAFLMERNSELVAHPLFTAEGQTVYDLEFSSPTSSEANAFKTIISTALEEGRGQAQYYKNGKLWYMTYAVIPNVDFLLAVVVPASEVVAPAIAMLNAIVSQTLILTLILIGVLASVAAVVTGVAYAKGKAVVQPVREMTKLVQKMSTQDFTRSMSMSGAMYEEIGTTIDALLSFQEACRYGNQSFIRGDLRRALANYENLLEISRRLAIEEGIQTMLLNIGNVYRQRGDTRTATDHYNRSLEIAKAMLERSKEGGKDESDALQRIGSIYHNMALVSMDRGEFDTAMKHLEEAEAIDRTLKNELGLAKRFDAMGLVMLRQNRISQALSRFEEAERIALRQNAERTLAYIQYHKGELYETQKQWQKAEVAFEEAVRLSELTQDNWLQVYALSKLADVLDQLDKSSHDVRRRAERLRRSAQFKKSVIFVIDYSGSMQAQDRIRAAVMGAKEIVRSHVNPQDDVSVIVFNDAYTEVLPLTRRGEFERDNESNILRTLDTLRHPSGATAFYDALGKALESLDRIPSSEHRWVIALTDGQDNSSKTYSLDLLKGIVREKDRMKKKKPLTIEGYIRDNHLDVNLIVIGVGNELKLPAAAGAKSLRSPVTGQIMTTEDLLQYLCNNVPQGQYLSVVDSTNVRRDVQKAFEQVAVMMAQLEVGGSTVEY